MLCSEFRILFAVLGVTTPPQHHLTPDFSQSSTLQIHIILLDFQILDDSHIPISSPDCFIFWSIRPSSSGVSVPSRTQNGFESPSNCIKMVTSWNSEVSSSTSHSFIIIISIVFHFSPGYFCKSFKHHSIPTSLTSPTSFP